MFFHGDLFPRAGEEDNGKSRHGGILGGSDCGLDNRMGWRGQVPYR